MAPETHTEGAPKSTSDSRWWEYYAVRYALGVGIGTPIVVLLWHTYANPLSPANQIPSPFAGTTSALLWAAAGTAYCYVASVPILTLHSTRRLLPRTRFWVNTLFCAVPIIFTIAGLLDTVLLSKPVVLKAAGFSTLLAITCTQLFLLWRVLRYPQSTHRFYEDLDFTRGLHPDYVESYRHMREHGNSISIVICELLLAFVLWSLRPTGSAGGDAAVARVGIILAAWLTPACLVWFVASSLERHLAHSNVRE